MFRGKIRLFGDLVESVLGIWFSALSRLAWLPVDVLRDLWFWDLRWLRRREN
jgi:hypothetical protein